MKRVLFILLLSSAWQSASAWMSSENESLQMVYGNEQSLSLATGYSQLLYKAPAVATVITRQQIETSTAITLNQLLEQVPGLHVSEHYAYGDAIFGMRGFQREPNAGLLVLMNGVPLNNLQNGSRPAAFQMPVSVIDHVEIIRGPGSAVYGADAFIGVINVITRGSNSIKQAEVGSGIGMSGYQTLWYQDAIQVRDWKMSVTLDWLAAGNDDAQSVSRDMQSFLDELNTTNASLAPDQMETAYKTINVMAEQQKGDWLLRQWLWSNLEQKNAHGIPGIDVLDPEGETDSMVLGLSADYSHAYNDDWLLAARASWLRYDDKHDAQILPPGSEALIGDDGNLFTSGARSVVFNSGMQDVTETEENHLQIEASAFYRGMEKHVMRATTGAQYFDFSASEQRNFGPGVLDGGQNTAPDALVDTSSDALVYLPENDRRNVYLMLQDEWDFVRDWSFTAGVRHDHYSDFGATTNPRLALVWQTRHDLTSKLLYGQAFRAPVFNELYIQNRPGNIGNENLQAETIRTLELSFLYRPLPSFKTTLSLYRYTAEDLIVTANSTVVANTNTLENAAEQNGHGLEWEASWYARDNLQITGNFSWQYSPIPDTEFESPLAPFREAWLQVNWRPAKFWMLHNNLHWLDSGAREVSDPREPLDDQLRFDITLRYRNYNTPWEYSLLVRNLFDEDLREPSLGNGSIADFNLDQDASLADDVPQAGRVLFAQVNYRFK